MPHSWKLGSVVHPHIHYRQTAAAIPNFLLQYRWQVNGQAETTAWTNYICNVAAYPYTSGNINQIVHDGGITPPIGATISDIVEFRVLRDNGNTSGLFAGADALSATVRVKFFDVHYEIDTLGSNTEYVK
jgi:hypothetical protein